MISSAKAKHIRISARKVRLVLDLVRGKSTKQALSILQQSPKRSAGVINKLLRSAISNAKNKGFEDEGLHISRIFAATEHSYAIWAHIESTPVAPPERQLKHKSATRPHW